MSTLESLQGAVLARPEADEPRLAYADAVRTSDPDRAELIALQVTLSRWRKQSARPAGWADGYARQQILLDRHRDRWSADVRALGWVQYPNFLRGFVEYVTADAKQFLAHAAELYRRAPILHLDVTGLKQVARTFFDSPLLEQLTSLGIWRNQLDDDEIEMLAESPHVRRLAWLDASHNQIDRRGIEALCRSENLPRLAYLNLDDNTAPDPTPKIGGFDPESSAIMDLEYPTYGKELEARFGKKRWLSPDFRPSFPPGRDAV